MADAPHIAADERTRAPHARSPDAAPPVSSVAPAQPLRSSAGRLARLVGVCLLVIASLLTFPAGLPWMIVAWLAWTSAAAIGGGRAWFPLTALVVILAVKRPAWLPGMIGFVVVAAVADAWFMARWRLSGRTSARVSLGMLAALWLAWGAMLWDWRAGAQSAAPPALDPLRPIACIGDSLTSGVEPDGGFPQDLAPMLAVPVADFGRAGISTRDGLKMLPDLLAKNPQAVVVELGGHDYLRNYGRDATEQNLEQIIAACQRIGAVVILVEVPRGFITDPFDGLERKLARRHDLQLIADTPVRRLVLWSNAAPPGMWLDKQARLSDDGLHPNHRGNVVLAKAVADALAQVYGPSVLKP